MSFLLFLAVPAKNRPLSDTFLLIPSRKSRIDPRFFGRELRRRLCAEHYSQFYIKEKKTLRRAFSRFYIKGKKTLRRGVTVGREDSAQRCHRRERGDSAQSGAGSCTGLLCAEWCRLMHSGVPTMRRVVPACTWCTDDAQSGAGWCTRCCPDAQSLPVCSRRCCPDAQSLPPCARRCCPDAQRASLCARRCCPDAQRACCCSRRCCPDAQSLLCIDGAVPMRRECSCCPWWDIPSRPCSMPTSLSCRCLPSVPGCMPAPTCQCTDVRSASSADVTEHRALVLLRVWAGVHVRRCSAQSLHRWSERCTEDAHA